jgi:hypothetical protein
VLTDDHAESLVRQLEAIRLELGFETMDLLKARSYYWDTTRKTWYRTVTGTNVIKAEVAWLKETINKGSSVKLKFDVRDAQSRYSRRPVKRQSKEI